MLTSWRTDWEGDRLALPALLCSLPRVPCASETKVWVPSRLRVWNERQVGRNHTPECSLLAFEKILKKKGYKNQMNVTNMKLPHIPSWLVSFVQTLSSKNSSDGCATSLMMPWDSFSLSPRRAAG